MSGDQKIQTLWLSALNTSETNPIIEKIPFHHLIFNPKKTLKNVIEHCHSVYNAVFFLVKIYLKVKQPKDTDFSAIPIQLGSENEGNKLKKTLFMSLEGTLIHISETFEDQLFQVISTLDQT